MMGMIGWIPTNIDLKEDSQCICICGISETTDGICCL